VKVTCELLGAACNDLALVTFRDGRRARRIDNPNFGRGYDFAIGLGTQLGLYTAANSNRSGRHLRRTIGSKEQAAWKRLGGCADEIRRNGGATAKEETQRIECTGTSGGKV